jgi:ABC-type Fe3+-hydroxamate transport system substrate-binding protein
MVYFYCTQVIYIDQFYFLEGGFMFNRNVVACIFLAVFLVVVSGCSQKTDVSYTPQNFTDENWVKGIAKTWAAAFFVPGSIKEETKNDFAVGRKATFSDGTVRTIVKLEENAGNLIVFVDGAPLDGNVVGYPKKIKVIAAAK